MPAQFLVLSTNCLIRKINHMKTNHAVRCAAAGVTLPTYECFCHATRVKMGLPDSFPAGNASLPVIIAAALLWLSSSGAFAATLFSNLGQTSSGTAAGIAIPSQLMATKFLIGGSASSVTGLTIRIQNNDSIQHNYSAYLYADSTGAPQANGLLTTFTPVSATLPASQTALAIFSHAGLALAANTRYWLALGIGEGSNLSSSAFVETASNSADVGSIFSNASPPTCSSVRIPAASGLTRSRRRTASSPSRALSPCQSRRERCCLCWASPHSCSVAAVFLDFPTLKRRSA